MSKKSVRGGNSAFFKDGLFHTDGDQGCPRRVLLRSYGVEPPVGDIRTQKTFNVGFLNEELFVKHYLPGILTSLDHAISEPITKNINFEGHADVVTKDLVFELKSVTSKSTWDKVKKGKPKLSNVAQCVNYMLSRQTQKGYLVYSLYAYVDGINLPDVFFEITIDNEGEILLNGKSTGYNLEHTVLDRQTKARVLEDDVVFPERPVNPGGDKSPCFYCPFKAVCDQWDKAKINTTQEFLEKAKETVNAIELEENLNRQERLRKAAEKFGG